MTALYTTCKYLYMYIHLSAPRLHNHYNHTASFPILADMGPPACNVLWIPGILCRVSTEVPSGYTIYQIRFNGSAIETFFSQLKFATSGHVSGTNYATARSSVLTRGSVKGRRKCTDYQKLPLYIRQHNLAKKLYQRKN